MNNKLNKKYWLAETSSAEEQQLKKEIDTLADEKEQNYFNTLHQFSELKLDETFEQNILAAIEEKSIIAKKRITWSTYKRTVASFLLLITAGSIYWSIQKQQRTMASEVAFEEAKSALLLISTQLNKGTSSTYTITKFSSTQQKLKK